MDFYRFFKWSIIRMKCRLLSRLLSTIKGAVFGWKVNACRRTVGMKTILRFFLSCCWLSIVAVIVETVEDGRTRAQHYTVDTLSEVTLLRSLVLAVNQKQPGAHVTLYVDCVSQGMVATPRAMRDMFHKMANPRIQVVSLSYEQFFFIFA